MTEKCVYEVMIADVGILANAIIIYPVLAKNPKKSWKVGQWFFMYCDDYIRLSPRLVSARITVKGFLEVLNEITKDACKDDRLSKFNIHSDITFYDRWNIYKSLLYKIEEKQKWI
jgi:hypothetical protein